MARDQKRHASDKEVAEAPPVAAPVSSGSSHAEPHPSLIKIVRLLARQTAMADIAAQQNTPSEE
ncbi:MULTISPECIES: hypothetical protein [Pacificibacter]|uniref:hypothetical protein n=1 Tax=Pacificibacter TaxID=1042323 RepID=UPI001C082421|nr:MULTISPECIES: hypothetical protein [Pacificibacter]MBU2935167.1 hypothetical protein [Pacificibacter marinus]MDO6615959.1 hypothetical protein [Pacificibacter sp. 1_MG-2023]